jgi:hypothetical protein
MQIEIFLGCDCEPNLTLYLLSITTTITTICGPSLEHNYK